MRRSHDLSTRDELELEEYPFSSPYETSTTPDMTRSVYQSPFMRTGTDTQKSTAPGFDEMTTAHFSQGDNGNFANRNNTISYIDDSSLNNTETMAIKLMNIDRYSFGFDRLPIYPTMVRWRISDLVFGGLTFVLFLISWSKQIEPFQRQFFINDLTISHPFAEHERVTAHQLLFVSFAIPTAIIILLTLIFTPVKHKIYVLFVSLLGLYISLFTNCLITEILKVWIGRHRPDFLARCIVREGTPINTMVFAKDVCTTDDMGKLLDGFKTTPSGHSSISFAGLGYLSMWLCGQFLVSHIDTGAWRSILSGLPLLGSSYVAFSRTEDYRHHFVDVILGSILGSLIAWWSYRRIFPSITDDFCYLPYQLISEEKQRNGGSTPYTLATVTGYQLADQQDEVNSI